MEWVDTSGEGAVGAQRDDLLAKVERVLGGAGPRSLHVRQIAEALAAEDVLGGEISEVERAVTAAILLDVHQRGRGSRFAIRGDARYQLHGARVPEPAAKAEKAFRDAGLALEAATRTQVSAWLASLGARALEALVRVHLETEGFNRIASLPPGRGLGKLMVDDPEADEDERRQLVLVVPAKTALEPKLWEGEAERAGCHGVVVFAMGDISAAPGDVRIVGTGELSAWLIKHQVGVRRLEMSVPVLDPAVIESIGGLDT